jgi:hypothetical protein
VNVPNVPTNVPSVPSSSSYLAVRRDILRSARRHARRHARRRAVVRWCLLTLAVGALEYANAASTWLLVLHTHDGDEWNPLMRQVLASAGTRGLFVSKAVTTLYLVFWLWMLARVATEERRWLVWGIGILVCGALASIAALELWEYAHTISLAFAGR